MGFVDIKKTYHTHLMVDFVYKSKSISYFKIIGSLRLVKILKREVSELTETGRSYFRE